tara:strand:+ start:271 stop:417 length:147 start_codon:yes stop_codon:yes gene_type:complete
MRNFLLHEFAYPIFYAVGTGISWKYFSFRLQKHLVERPDSDWCMHAKA